MINSRLVLPLMLACVLSSAPASRAQDSDVLAREGDEAAMTAGERRSALAALLAAAPQALEAGEPLKAARFLIRAGRLQLLLNQPQAALATYREARAALGREPDAAADVDALNVLGGAYTHLSKCDKARPTLERAVALSEQSGYVPGKAEALLTLSDCQNYGDPALALRTAQESLALWQAAGQKRGAARSYSAIGEYQMVLSDLAESTRSHEAALELWRELGVASEQGEALINLGYIEIRKGAWENAIALLTRAQGLIDEESYPSRMGQIATGLAETFVGSGLPEIGLEKFQQATEYYRKAEKPRSVNALVWYTGTAQYTLGRYAEALESLQRARAEAEAQRDPRIMALCDDFLGRTYAARGEYAAALRHFRVALREYTRADNPMEPARVRAMMGRVYERQGKAAKARDYYRKALEAFDALSDRVNGSATLYALGGLEMSQNNLGAAEDYLRRSIEATENMRRVSTSSDLTAAFSATVHERYESYVECLMRRHRAEPSRGLDAAAFEQSELARGRSLAELLKATQTSLAEGLDPQLAERERSLRQTLRVKEDDRVRLLGRVYKAEQLAALNAELARLEAEYRQVNEAISARHPSYDRLTRPAAWDAKRIREHVVADDQTVLLAYSVGAGASYVWAVTRDGVTSHELPARAALEEAARKVYESLVASPGPESESWLAQAAGELSRLVLAPVAARLDKQRIIVVADGPLNYVPFQLLPSPKGGEPLVADYEVVNAPSASILGELREERARRQPAANLLAAFGDPVTPSNYARRKDPDAGELVASAQTPGSERLRQALRDIEPGADTLDPSSVGELFFAGRELASLREVAAGGGSVVAEGFDATRERLKNTDLTKFAILHFATHGLLDPVRPENSGLVLSTVNAEGREQEGFVALQDVYTLRAPVELVVLSACRTGLGKDVRGEGLIGLTRAFMYAGASGVVSSLWKVDDEATAQLMKHFYEYMLRDGMKPAAALRAAQNDIRREPLWRSPRYWAAFTLQGEYQQTIKPAAAAGSYPKAIAGGALFVLLAGGAWGRRRRRLRRAQGEAAAKS